MCVRYGEGAFRRNSSLILLVGDVWFSGLRLWVVQTTSETIRFQICAMPEPRRCCERLLAHWLQWHKSQSHLLRPRPSDVPDNICHEKCDKSSLQHLKHLRIRWPTRSCHKTRLFRVRQLNSRPTIAFKPNYAAEADVDELSQLRLHWVLF